MIISIHGLREGTGSSFLAANLAQILSESKPVALVSTSPSPGTFETYWGLPLTGTRSWVRQLESARPITDAAVRADHGFPVLLPCGDAQMPDDCDGLARKLLSTLNAQAFGCTIIDAGACGSRRDESFCALSDIVVCVLEPDHDSLLRLDRYQPLDNEVFVLNKVVPGSTVGYRLTSYLETEPRFIGKLITPVLPLDEAARESGFLMTRVTKSAPQSAVSQTIRSCTQSLLVAADRLGRQR